MFWKRLNKLMVEIAVYLVLYPFARGRRIRIVSLRWKGKISIMISYLEPYLRSLVKEYDRFPLVIALNFGDDPNEQLSRMYRRKLILLDNRHPLLRQIVSSLYTRCKRVDSKISPKLESGHLLGNEIWGSTPALCFTKQEISRGELLINEIGLEADSRFIAFGLRESSYYKSFADRLRKDIETGKLPRTPKTTYSSDEHGKDQEVRNPELETYVTALQHPAIAIRPVIRMGSVVNGPIVNNHSGIVDYAANHRTPFGDIFLLSRCDFVIAGGAPGIWWVAAAFNGPTVTTDGYYIHSVSCGPKDLMIPQKVRCSVDGHLLSLKELNDRFPRDVLPVNDYAYKSVLEKEKLELVKNTAEEIVDVVLEMQKRLSVDWVTDPLDYELKEKFMSCFPPDDTMRQIGCRVGAKFLRENQYLLE